MARLQWNDIRAPEVDIRGLAIASQGITGGFDRLAKALSDREASLRAQATNKINADVLLASTPEEIAALRASGFANMDPRVDRAAVAKTLAEREGQIQETALTAEELAAARDPAKFAGDYMELSRLAALDPNSEEARATAARLASQGARGIQEAYQQGFSNFDTITDNTRDEASRLDRRRGDYLNYQAAQARTAVAQQGLAMEQSRYEQGLAREQAQRDAFASGASAVENLSPSASVGDIETTIKNSPAYRALADQPAEVRSAYLSGARERYTARTTITEAARVAAGIPTLEAATTRMSGQAGVVRSSIENNLRMQNPQADVLTRAALPEYQAMKFEDVVKRASTTNIYNPEQYVTEMQRRGVSLPELAAAIDVYGATDRSWADPRTYLGDSWKNAFVGGGLPMNIIRARTLGTQRLTENVQNYQKALLAGAPQSQAEQASAVTAQVTALEDTAKRLLERQTREAAAGDKAAVARTQEAIQALQEDMRELYRQTAEPKPTRARGGR